MHVLLLTHEFMYNNNQMVLDCSHARLCELLNTFATSDVLVVYRCLVVNACVSTFMNQVEMQAFFLGLTLDLMSCRRGSVGASFVGGPSTGKSELSIKHARGELCVYVCDFVCVRVCMCVCVCVCLCA